MCRLLAANPTRPGAALGPDSTDPGPSCARGSRGLMPGGPANHAAKPRAVRMRGVGHYLTALEAAAGITLVHQVIPLVTKPPRVCLRREAIARRAAAGSMTWG